MNWVGEGDQNPHKSQMTQNTEVFEIQNFRWRHLKTPLRYIFMYFQWTNANVGAESNL